MQPVTHIGLQRGGGVHLLLLALVLARTLLAVAGPAAAPELDRVVVGAGGEQMAQRVPRQRPDGRLVRLTRDVHAMGMCVAWECACHDGCTAHAWGYKRGDAHLPAVAADGGLKRLGVLRRPEVDGAVEATRDEELGVHGVPRQRGHL